MQKPGPVHVATVRRRYKDTTYVSHLLRRSYRQDGKVKSETVGNISALPDQLVEVVRRALAGEAVLTSGQLESQRSLAHGHVQAVLTMARKLGLAALLDPRPSRQRDLCLAMITFRLLEPGSKLAATRSWHNSTLAAELGVEDADEDELYGAMDWLLKRQGLVEQRLAKRHLREGGLVLYDLTSSVLTGRHCPLAAIGHSRDGKPGTLQIEYGLLTDEAGRPVACEVFAGNAGDPSTVASQVKKLKEKFALNELILVGDRGMLTSARIRALQEVPGLAWISALRGPQIRSLVESGSIQMSLFDQHNLAEITDPGYPGERLVVCRNPNLAADRARKREELLVATELRLAPILRQVEKGRLRTTAEIAIRVGKVIDRYKMAKHFQVEIADGRLQVTRKQAQIRAEAGLDGIYVIRTPVPPERLSSAEVVRSYKRLTKVERAFKSLKSIDLQVRPVHHYSEDRVRAHVLLCMLSYYLRWHLEQVWAPLLFKDEDPPLDGDPVLPSRRSVAAETKARTQLLEDGTPAHSWRTLISALAGLSRVWLLPKGAPAAAAFTLDDTPNRLQARALALVSAFRL